MIKCSRLISQNYIPIKYFEWWLAISVITYPFPQGQLCNLFYIYFYVSCLFILLTSLYRISSLPHNRKEYSIAIVIISPASCCIPQTTQQSKNKLTMFPLFHAKSVVLPLNHTALAVYFAQTVGVLVVLFCLKFRLNANVAI